MSTQLNVKLVKSHIGKPPAQTAVLRGLGLTKINKTVTLQDTPEIRGMVKKVDHLVKIVD